MGFSDVKSIFWFIVFGHILVGNDATMSANTNEKKQVLIEENGYKTAALSIVENQKNLQLESSNI